MLTEICQYLHNWFEKGKFISCITIADGKISTADDGELSFFEGQYFRVIGSIQNDGVHQYPAELKDETFDGAVWMMGVPADFLALVSDIEAWVDKYGQSVNSPYASESFAGYSRSLRGVAGGEGSTWQSVFKSRLNAWRKL